MSGDTKIHEMNLLGVVAEENTITDVLDFAKRA
jgi:hypothetical protein